MTLTHHQSLTLGASSIVQSALAAWVEPTWWDYTEIRDMRKALAIGRGHGKTNAMLTAMGLS